MTESDRPSITKRTISPRYNKHVTERRERILYSFQIGERDRLKNELEHEQRITLEVESWLRDRQAYLNQLVILTQILLFCVIR